MLKEKRSFFERLTGTINVDDEDFENELHDEEPSKVHGDGNDWMEEENEEGQLMVDVYQTDDEITIQAMVAGIHASDLNISITREMVTIAGNRKAVEGISDENYFYKELYWGAFSRTILLPQEIEPDQAEASEKNGLLTLKLPKIDKEKVQRIKVKMG